MGTMAGAAVAPAAVSQATAHTFVTHDSVGNQVALPPTLASLEAYTRAIVYARHPMLCSTIACHLSIPIVYRPMQGT